MERWKRRLIWGGIVAGVLALLYAALTFLFLDYYVDYAWFSSMELGGYFLLRVLYRYLVLAAAVLFFFLVFFLNFFIAARFLGTRPPRGADSESRAGRVYRDLSHLFLIGSMKAYIPLSFILAVVLALPLYGDWEKTLLFLFGPVSGTKAVIFGRDVSYFLFSYPVYTLIEKWLLLGLAVSFVGTVFLYWMEKRCLQEEGRDFPGGARVHMSVMVFLFFVILAWGFVLQRDGLVFTDTHLPMFYGPGFVEMRLTQPLLYALTFLCLVLGAGVIFFIHTGKGLKPLAILAAIFALFLGAERTPYLTDLVQRYWVKPNEIEKERRYMANSIQATLAAYGLDRVETRRYSISHNPGELVKKKVLDNLQNVPVWDRELLRDVYFQLQGLRPYYSFPHVDVDRYTVGGLYQQVFLAAREIDMDRLPEGAKNWINTHLRYTHGNGVVMTPAAQGGDEGMTWFINDVPPTSEYGLSIKRPQIYYGQGALPYVLVPNGTGEMDSFSGGVEQTVNYAGTGGVPMGNLFRKLVFWAYFKDSDIFFTSKTNRDTRVLFRRNVVERIRRITPFLVLDNDPYVVVTENRLYWIQDAYTTSRDYPNAAFYGDRFNTMRNSIKIVVDAYNGKVNYYLVDRTDVIARAYQRIYPGLIKDLAKMPRELRRHLRYPRDFFTMQMGIYGKYHQKEPSVFFQEQDRWEFSATYNKEQRIPIKPYYLTLDLLKPGTQEFFLLLPMNPIRRDNLRALAVGRSDLEHYGDIVVYLMPEGKQVYGPSQIGTVISIDPDIAQQFTLWDQAGSEVILGRMIILPIADEVIYVQPVYLRSTTNSRFPELKRVIVCIDNIAVMDSTLEQAFDRLQDRLAERQERQRKNYPPVAGVTAGEPVLQEAQAAEPSIGPAKPRQEQSLDAR